MNNRIKVVLQKPMNRTGFLKLVGGVALTVVGVPAILKVIAGGGEVHSNASSSQSAAGYGSTGYGR